ncbi:hypothetical protein M8J76_015464 [Diaphorina citri]|nr:hypothetical protein M8J75_007578 [Diaphorina citri]KAI5750416.1 hypothetical protein M8J76_015464 [Diaphorina citri]
MSLMKLSLLLGLVCVGLTVAVVFLSYSLLMCEHHELSTSKPTPSSLMSTPNPLEPWEKDFRLSPAITPFLYDLKLHPDLKTALFTVEEKILVTVTHPVDYIYLHIDRLNVTKSVVTQNGVQVPVKRAFSYPKHQYWVVQLERNLELGECTLEFTADGNLKKQDIVGFYQSTYQAISGETR